MKPSRLNVVALATLAAALAGAVEGRAQDRIGFGYSIIGDGTCSVRQHTMVAEYGSTSDSLAVRGRVRSEPSGGDCRREAFSYDVRFSHYIDLDAVDATVEFSAAQETTAAPYVLTDGQGAVLLREDAQALFSTNLPAGAAQTVVAAFGLSRQLGPVRLGALVNLAPIQWAGHPPGRTGRLTWDLQLRGVYLEGSVDRGRSTFGVASGGYRFGVAGPFDVSAGLTWRWGLAAIDAGAPGRQLVAGAPFLLDGPPQDHSLVTAVTVGYRIGG